MVLLGTGGADLFSCQVMWVFNARWNTGICIQGIYCNLRTDNCVSIGGRGLSTGQGIFSGKLFHDGVASLLSESTV